MFRDSDRFGIYSSHRGATCWLRKTVSYREISGVDDFLLRTYGLVVRHFLLPAQKQSFSFWRKKWWVKNHSAMIVKKGVFALLKKLTSPETSRTNVSVLIYKEYYTTSIFLACSDSLKERGVWQFLVTEGQTGDVKTALHSVKPFMMICGRLVSSLIILTSMLLWVFFHGTIKYCCCCNDDQLSFLTVCSLLKQLQRCRDNHFFSTWNANYVFTLSSRHLLQECHVVS